MKTHLVISDFHAHPDHNNTRSDWLGRLILDLKPDVVVNLGDWADMPSLSSYDKGTKGFQGRTYQKDIDCANEALDRLYNPIKQAKRKRPRMVSFIGNHEQRITRAISVQPELEGTIDLKNIELGRYSSTIVDYEGLYPGTLDIDGVSYSHYMVSGVMGRPIGGERHASTLITKKLTSCTVGHTHIFDFHLRPRPDGSKAQALVSPCSMDYDADWAGQSGKMWSKGVVIKRNVQDGMYDMEYVSMERLAKVYSDVSRVGRNAHGT